MNGGMHRGGICRRGDRGWKGKEKTGPYITITEDDGLLVLVGA